MTRTIRSRLLAPLLLAAAALVSAGLLAGCGEKPEDQTAVTGREKVTIVLDYFPNADHAAIYAALGSGAFERAGLDVQIQAPGDASTPLKLLEAGKADFVITYQPELVLARAKGQKVQAVAALVQEPLTSLISLKPHGITRGEQLKGKTVGTAGLNYQAAYVDTILKAAGVRSSSVKRVDLGFNLTQPLIAKKVDASLGAFWNYEGIELQRKKKHPVITKIQDLGVPTYDELMLAASEDTIRDRGPVVRRLVQAIATGAKLLKTDPNAGIDPLLQASPGLDRGLQEAVLEATLPVMFPKDADHPFGWIDETEWAAYARWLQAQGLVSDATIAARGWTNEFLPGEGVGDDDGGGQSVQGI
ncbi:MAG: ABC transporter substrate-binding protein [Solirubrobacteraceae bacterium]|nr:ABC transporter substrate-binding protein [Solirubrobacteraceae bacterium]